MQLFFPKTCPAYSKILTAHMMKNFRGAQVEVLHYA